MKEYAAFTWHAIVLLVQTAGYFAVYKVKPAGMSRYLHKKIEWRTTRLRELWAGTGPTPDED